MKELETQLRAWPLRRPSRKLERRLFERPRAEAPTGFSFGWLLPATAALLVCLLVTQGNSPDLAGSTRQSQVVAMMMSNQSAAAYLPTSFERDHNTLSADTFEWTNGAGYTSSIRSLSAPRGNQQ